MSNAFNTHIFGNDSTEMITSSYSFAGHTVYVEVIKIINYSPSCCFHKRKTFCHLRNTNQDIFYEVGEFLSPP